MSKVLDIRHYQFSAQDRLLIDTNVWLHIYASKENPSSQTKIYSQAFERMLNAKSLLFIDAIIFSEFMSNYVRLHNVKSAKKFKEFRDSEKFSGIAKATAEIARDMLKRCQRINNNFEEIKIENLLTDFENNNVDFKDQLIMEVCKSHQLTLVTDDGDFKSTTCKVLTANKSLLREINNE